MLFNERPVIIVEQGTENYLYKVTIDQRYAGSTEKCTRWPFVKCQGCFSAVLICFIVKSSQVWSS